MKKITLIIVFIVSYSITRAQCEAPDLSLDSPSSADNSGSVTNFAAIAVGEYEVLENLLVGNNYEITTANDLIGPFDEAYITLRSTSDNSVVAFGFTPLSFTASEEDIEVHAYSNDLCSVISDLDVLAIQNLTVLSSEEFELVNVAFYPNPTKGEILLKGNLDWENISLIDISGKEILKINPEGNQNSININFLTKGSYFLRTKFRNGNTSIKKIIKI